MNSSQPDKMSVKDVYDMIDSNCLMALWAGTTIEDWEAMSEEDRMKIAEDNVDWFSESFRRE